MYRAVATITNPKTDYSLTGASENALGCDFNVVALGGINPEVADSVYYAFGKLVIIQVVACDAAAAKKQIVECHGIPAKLFRTRTHALIGTAGGIEIRYPRLPATK